VSSVGLYWSENDLSINQSVNQSIIVSTSIAADSRQRRGTDQVSYSSQVSMMDIDYTRQRRTMS